VPASVITLTRAQMRNYSMPTGASACSTTAYRRRSCSSSTACR
jgi:hypothetical protein